MSAFVLNRSYELQLPNSFVDVDCEEMEYVDGGNWLRDKVEDLLVGLVGAALWEYRGQISKYMIRGAIAAYTWVANAVTAACAWIVANPAISAGILGVTVGAVAGYVVGRYF